MIPKIIHYCWFGGKPLPPSALKCIASWKKFFPDYEIRECNEHNFNIHICAYTSEAYKQKKYAFVSDYARFWLLYHYGGIYFDVDVQVIRPFDKILSYGSFMGFEDCSDGNYPVNPGIGMGAEPHTVFLKQMLSMYDNKNFIFERGMENIVTITTVNLVQNGLVPNNLRQNICDFNIYPTDFFCPLSKATGKLKITFNTVSIHLYDGSWLSTKGKIAQFIKMNFGEYVFNILCKIKRLFK